jgi:hypothetical protein
MGKPLLRRREMIILKEGLRVITTKPIKWICVTPYNRVYDRDFGGDADIVQAGIIGTVFEFRIREMPVECGGRHHYMFGVVYDGVPAPAAGWYGVVDGKDLELAPIQQNEHLSSLRGYWQGKLAERRMVEEELARKYKQYGPFSWGPTKKELFEQYNKTRDACREAQKAYDMTANIPEREV